MIPETVTNKEGNFKVLICDLGFVISFQIIFYEISFSEQQESSHNVAEYLYILPPTAKKVIQKNTSKHKGNF